MFDLHSSPRLHDVPSVTKALHRKLACMWQFSLTDGGAVTTSRQAQVLLWTAGPAEGLRWHFHCCGSSHGPSLTAPQLCCSAACPKTPPSVHPSSTLLLQQPFLSPVSHTITALHMPLQFPFPHISILPILQQTFPASFSSPLQFPLCCCFGGYCVLYPWNSAQGHVGGWSTDKVRVVLQEIWQTDFFASIWDSLAHSVGETSPCLKRAAAGSACSFLPAPQRNTGLHPPLSNLTSEFLFCSRCVLSRLFQTVSKMIMQAELEEQLQKQSVSHLHPQFFLRICL